MSNDTEQLTVTVQAREFRFKCPIERKGELLDAVERLNRMIEDFGRNHRSSSLEHMVVLVAINLICERTATSARVSDLVVQLQEKCGSLVGRLTQLNIDLDTVLISSEESREVI